MGLWRSFGEFWSCQCCTAEGGARGELPSKGQRAEQGSCLVLLLFVLLPLLLLCCVFFCHKLRVIWSPAP